jgi:tetratricopeptide (TPR) repeat protein
MPINEVYHKELDDFVDQLRDRPEFGPSLADHYYNTHIEYWINNPSKLLSGFEVGIRIEPHPIAYYILGLCYLQLHKYEESIVNFQKSLDYNPNFYPAIENLALLRHQHNLLGKELEYLPPIIQEFYNAWFAATKPGKLQWQRITEAGHIVTLKYKYQDMYGFETDYGDICGENVTVTEGAAGFLKYGQLYDGLDKYSLSIVHQISMGSVPIIDEVDEGRKKKFIEMTGEGNVGRPNEVIRRWTKIYMRRFNHNFHSGYHENESYEDFVNGKNYAQRFSWLHAAFLPTIDMHKGNQISVLLRTPK